MNGRSPGSGTGFVSLAQWCISSGGFLAIISGYSRRAARICSLSGHVRAAPAELRREMKEVVAEASFRPLRGEDLPGLRLLGRVERDSPSRSARRRKIRLTDQDLGLLSFLAEHRLVLPDHAAELLGSSLEAADARLTRLAAAGYVRRERLFHGRPPMHLITGAGLKVIGSSFETPRIDVRCYEHDVGVAWLWLAARRGTFGPVSEIIAERRIRSHDGSRERGLHRPEPLAVRLGGVGPRGQERLHYPDVLLRTPDGRRLALELELSTKGAARLETILAGYGADRRIDGVVYLVQSHSVARAVQAAARRLGVSSLVHVQRVRLHQSGRAPAGTLSANRGHPVRAPGSTRAASSRQGHAPEAAL